MWSFFTDVVDNDSKTLEVMESNNNQQSHNSQEEWQKEIEEPNALAYVIFNSRDYSKYFAKNHNWIHIRYVILRIRYIPREVVPRAEVGPLFD